MNNNDIEQALLDVRKSQRLLVAFHQRILPIIETIAAGLGCDFHYWQPSNQLKTPQGNANPLTRWGWDLSPLNDATFLFLTQGAERNIARHDQWALAIRLQTDTGISESFLHEDKDWDALNLLQTPEKSETALALIAYKPTETLNENWAWWNIYAETDFPPSSGDVLKGYAGAEAFCFSVNIEHLFTENGTQNAISGFKSQLISKGFITGLSACRT